MPFTTRAEILKGSTTDVLYVKKLSLGKYYMGTTAEFIDATPIIGEISDTYANVVSVQEYKIIGPFDVNFTAIAMIAIGIMKTANNNSAIKISNIRFI